MEAIEFHPAVLIQHLRRRRPRHRNSVILSIINTQDAKIEQLLFTCSQQVKSLHPVLNVRIGLEHSSFEAFITQQQQGVMGVVTTEVLAPGRHPVLVLRTRSALSADTCHAGRGKELSGVVEVGIATHGYLLYKVLVVVTFRNVLQVSEVLLAVLRTAHLACVALGEVGHAGVAVGMAAGQKLWNVLCGVVGTLAPGTVQEAFQKRSAVFVRVHLSAVKPS